MSKLLPISHKIYFIGNSHIISQYIEKFESLGFVLLSETDSYMTIFDKLQENKDLCFSHNWSNHFDIRKPKNTNNIILYFVGKYRNNDADTEIYYEIVSAAANISLKNISYIDEFEDEHVEKYIKEIYLNYFCGTPGVSAAAPFMCKIIELMYVLSFDSIIINTPLSNAIGFYESFGFTKPYVSSTALQLWANSSSPSYGGRKSRRRFSIYKRKSLSRKSCKRKRHKTKKRKYTYKNKERPPKTYN